MKVIVGLGNPGSKYKHTRHNLGFMYLDYLQQNYSFSVFQNESKFKGEIATGKLGGEKIILLKPSTFMNLSGESIQKVINFYKLEEQNWLVVYDDMSMELGKVRFRSNGSAGGHNGIKNIIQHFGKDFNRVKIGVDFDKRYDVSNWVLSKFKNEEIKLFQETVFEKIDNKITEEFLG